MLETGIAQSDLGVAASAVARATADATMVAALVASIRYHSGPTL